jgi:hypothetical protein
MTDLHLETALSLPSGFRFGEVSSQTAPRVLGTAVPSLGPLASFTGTFRGSGFNLIFRPDSAKTPTPLPKPITGSDNVLELNLTQETLSFSAGLGKVPNRGSGQQADAFLNGVPYLQTISDVTVPSQPVGIHFEPGIWLAVPPTTNPAEGATVARMASIPHGTTVEAQGKSFVVNGKPTIAAVDITPLSTDPVLAAGLAELQHADLAARLGSHAGAERPRCDPGLGLDLSTEAPGRRRRQVTLTPPPPHLTASRPPRTVRSPVSKAFGARTW